MVDLAAILQIYKQLRCSSVCESVNLNSSSLDGLSFGVKEKIVIKIETIHRLGPCDRDLPYILVNKKELI